jgi:hypothetical protein
MDETNRRHDPEPDDEDHSQSGPQLIARDKGPIGTLLQQDLQPSSLMGSGQRSPTPSQRRADLPGETQNSQ